MHVAVETSAHHIHLCQEHLDILFGYGYQLTPRKYLAQPGQFLTSEELKVIGPRGSMSMSVIGPLRPYTQVELSMTDTYLLGIHAPIRVSGDIRASGSCMLVGPCGEVDLEEGVIVAQRHLHLTPEDAELLHTVDGESLRVSVKTEKRSLTFEDVYVRVSPDCATCCHIDTDEANAVGLTGDGRGRVLL